MDSTLSILLIAQTCPSTWYLTRRFAEAGCLFVPLCVHWGQPGGKVWHATDMLPDTRMGR